jgi:sugar lactone lactonase YvrE
VYARLFSVVSCAAVLTFAVSFAFAQSSDGSEIKKSASATLPYGIISSVVGDGWYGFYGNQGPATAAELAYPFGVALDSAGNLYIADTGNHQVRVVSAATGVITTIAGTPESGYAGDKGPATKALLGCPQGLAVDAKGDVYIADTCNDAIRKVDAATKIISTVAGHPYRTRYNEACQFGGDNGPATSALLCFPAAVAVDSAGDLYISDTDNYEIRKVAANTGVITKVAGFPYYGVGLTGEASEGSPATSVELEVPQGIVVDAEKNIYFADAGFCLVRKITASTGLVTTVAGNVEGICGYASEGVLATASELFHPSGIALDKAGNLFIADTYSQLVRRVDAKSKIITTVAGDLYSFEDYPPGIVYNGLCGYTGDQGAAIVARLCDPDAVAIDAAENLYIADTSNSAIRTVTGTLAATTPPPTLTPAANGLGYGFGSPIEVRISDAASGAKIYYTTDGATPSTASKLYSGPFTVSNTGSVIAFATSANSANSDAAQGNYFRLVAPVITPLTGSFSKPTLVAITVPGYATAYYTTDGSNPCTSTTQRFYSQPFMANTALRLRAVGTVGSGCGPQTSAVFPIPTPPTATTGAATKVTATTATLNGTVYTGDLTTKYWFIYEPNCSSTNLKSTVVTLAAGTGTTNVSVNIAGLTKSTGYCYAIYASNADRIVQGDGQSFTTAN